jgi:hypothetical protein
VEISAALIATYDFMQQARITVDIASKAAPANGAGGGGGGELGFDAPGRAIVKSVGAH